MHYTNTDILKLNMNMLGVLYLIFVQEISQNNQFFRTQTGRVVGAGQVDRDQARAQDYLESLDEIDHMVMDSEATEQFRQPVAGGSSKPRTAKSKAAVKNQKFEFSSDSEDDVIEFLDTPASSDMDVGLDPNVTVAKKRRGRRAAKGAAKLSDPSEEDQDENKPLKKRGGGKKKSK